MCSYWTAVKQVTLTVGQDSQYSGTVSLVWTDSIVMQFHQYGQSHDSYSVQNTVVCQLCERKDIVSYVSIDTVCQLPEMCAQD